MDRRGALLFDLDGTLVDSALGIASALSQLSASRGGEAISTGVVRPLISQGVDVLVRGALGAMAQDTVRDVAEFRQILAETPADPGSIYPGVESALSALSKGGWALAIVTNKPERLSRLLLDQLALSASFGTVVGGDTLAVCKPDPAPLHHALAALDSGHKSAWMIGDSCVDALAARAADVPFVLFEGGYGAEDCDEADVALRFGAFEQLQPLMSSHLASAIR